MVIGVFAGLAGGVKYNALTILGAFLRFCCGQGFAGKADWTQWAPEAGLFLLAALVAVSPWLLKNQVFYHNPIFPLFNEFLQGLPGAGLAACCKTLTPGIFGPPLPPGEFHRLVFCSVVQGMGRFRHAFHRHRALAVHPWLFFARKEVWAGSPFRLPVTFLDTRFPTGQPGACRQDYRDFLFFRSRYWPSCLRCLFFPEAGAPGFDARLPGSSY